MSLKNIANFKTIQEFHSYLEILPVTKLRIVARLINKQIRKELHFDVKKSQSELLAEMKSKLNRLTVYGAKKGNIPLKINADLDLPELKSNTMKQKKEITKKVASEKSNATMDTSEKTHETTTSSEKLAQVRADAKRRALDRAVAFLKSRKESKNT